MLTFEVDWREIADGGVSSARIVETFDEVEDGEARLLEAGEVASQDEFTLEGGEEALTEGVVVAVPDAAHRGPDAGAMAAVPEGQRGVLTALIGVMDDIDRTTLLNGHVQGIEHQLGPEVVRHRPAHDASAEHVEDNGQIQEASGGRDVGDVLHTGSRPTVRWAPSP